MRKLIPALSALALASGAGAASAHHSFAVFFDQDKVVTVTGVVEEFRFANPHGTLAVIAKGKNGEPEEWRAETNSPSILLRRGWTPTSIKVGDTVTITGWAARDGSRYMRVQKAARADGSVIGAPVAAVAAEQK